MEEIIEKIGKVIEEKRSQKEITKVIEKVEEYLRLKKKGGGEIYKEIRRKRKS
jgi:hypothetical protein